MLSFWGLLSGGLVIFAGSGLALGAALGLTGLLILQFIANGATYVALDAVWNVLNSFTLSAIPLFIILGEIMLRSDMLFGSKALTAMCAWTSIRPNLMLGAGPVWRKSPA